MMKFPAARILVIDDNPGVVDILATHLRGEGYGVLSALTGDEGLKDFFLARPDLVLLDITLPGEIERDRTPQANPLDRSDQQGDHGDRERRPLAGPRGPRAWRDRLRRQAVRLRLPQTGGRGSASAGDRETGRALALNFPLLVILALVVIAVFAGIGPFRVEQERTQQSGPHRLPAGLLLSWGIW